MRRSAQLFRPPINLSSRNARSRPRWLGSAPSTSSDTSSHTTLRTIVFHVRACVDVPLRHDRRLYIDMTTTVPNTTSAPKDRTGRTPLLLVSIAQAAEMLSLSRSSIYQLIWNDELTPIRIGRSVRFSVEHLEAFVADRLAER